MRKLIALFLVIVSLFSLIGVVSADTPIVETSEPDAIMDFKDVDDTMWFYKSVQYAYFHNLMVGTEKNKFAPNTNVSRAMVVQVLYNLAGSPVLENREHPFTDVKEGAWYETAVIWAYQNHVVAGISETEAAPTMDVTREQLVTILHRAYQMSHEDEAINEKAIDKFPDANKVANWAKEAMNWAVGKGFISGVMEGNKTLVAPKGVTTRAQLATVMTGYHQKTAQEKHELLHTANYEDNKRYYWVYHCDGCDKTFHARVPMQEFQPLIDAVKSYFEDWGVPFDTSLDETNAIKREIMGLFRTNSDEGLSSLRIIIDTLTGYGYGRIWSCGVWGGPDGKAAANWEIGYDFESDWYTFTCYYINKK